MTVTELGAVSISPTREWFFVLFGVLGTGGCGQTLIDLFVAAGVESSYCGYA